VSYFGGDLSGSFRFVPFSPPLLAFKADRSSLSPFFLVRPALATRDDGRRRRKMLVHRHGGNVQTCSSACRRGEVWVEWRGGVG